MRTHERNLRAGSCLRRKSAASKRPPKAGPSAVAAMAANAAGDSRAAPAGSAPSSGRAASISRSRMLLRQARSGSAGHAPMTRPASCSPRCAIASSVSAVEFNVPRPDSVTTTSGAFVSYATDAIVLFVVVAHEQASRALDEDEIRGRLVLYPSHDARNVNRRLASDPGGCGRRQRSRVASELHRAADPVSRATSARSPASPGATPVWTGLTTTIDHPRARASAAIAAVTTVLPTPVPVPVTTSTLTALRLSHCTAASRPHVVFTESELTSASAPGRVYETVSYRVPMSDVVTDSPARGSGREAAICRAALELLAEVGYDRAWTRSLIAPEPARQRSTDTGPASTSWFSMRFAHAASARSRPSTREPCGDLLAVLHAIADGIAGEDIELMAGAVRAMRAAPELANCVRDSMIEDKRDVARVIVDRAIARRELPAHADPELLHQVAPAMILFQLLICAQPADEPYLEHVVDDVLTPS